MKFVDCESGITGVFVPLRIGDCAVGPAARLFPVTLGGCFYPAPLLPFLCEL